MKIKEKGQVTIFMIIVLFILIVVGLVLYNSGLGSKLWKKSISTIEEADFSLKSSVQECLKITGEEALKLIAIQGRIYPESFFTYQNNKVYYANKESITIEQMQNEISRYIDENIKICTQKIFEDFKKSGVEVIDKEPDAKTILALESVDINLNYPIEFTLVRTNQKSSISEFVQRFEIRLGKLHEISASIAKMMEKHGLINMTYLNSLDIDTTVIPYEDGTTLFVLEDNKSRIKQFNYAYSFALK